MKLLILGGTGVISSAIVGQGLAQGHEITVVNRGSRVSPFAGQIRCIQADRKDTAAFAAKMDKVRADVVIDMISFNPDDAEQTVRLFRDKADQLIFTSSSAAYQRPYRSLPIREEQELLSTSPDFPYGFYKAEMERYLQREMAKGDIPITIIRPSLTFGVGAANIGVLRQNYNIVRRMRDHLPLLMIGEGTIPWSFTFSDDLAKGSALLQKSQGLQSGVPHHQHPKGPMGGPVPRHRGADRGNPGILLCLLPGAVCRLPRYVRPFLV